MTDASVNNSWHITIPVHFCYCKVTSPAVIGAFMGDPVPIQHLRQLLAERLPQVRTGFARRTSSATVPTGVRRLDLALGGGLPLGETTELVGDGPGSGSAQVIHALLRQSASDGRFVALIDGADSLDVDALELGELAKLLWVRCRTVSEALSATDLLLRDRNFPLVVLDLKLNPAAEWQRVSGSVWHRFNRLREHHSTTLLVVTARPTVGGASRRVRVSAVTPGSSVGLGVARAGQAPEELLELLEFAVLREGTGHAAEELSPDQSAPVGERLALTG